MMMRIRMTLAIIMVRGMMVLLCMMMMMVIMMVMMILLVKRIVVQVHHAGEGGGEAHPVCDRAISVQPHHLVLLGHVVQEAEESFKLSCGYTTNCRCLSFCIYHCHHCHHFH